MSTLRVNTLQNTSTTDGGISINNSGHVTMDGVAYPSAGPLSNRNLIINGAFQVAQRGTSSTSSDFRTVDRFYYNFGNTLAGTQSQQSLSSGTPYNEGFRNFYRFAISTPGSATSTYCQLIQGIEAQNIATSGWQYASADSDITVSFWVRSSVAQTFYGALRSSDGTEQNYVFSFALSADTWTKVTKTIPGNTNVQIDNDNGQGAQLIIYPFMGTNFSDSSVNVDAWQAYSGGTRVPDMATSWVLTNGATFDVTGVQLEVGSVATPFEHRSYGDELARCQRYFYKIDGSSSALRTAHGITNISDGGTSVNRTTKFGVGSIFDGDDGNIVVPFPVTMRAEPTTDSSNIRLAAGQNIYNNASTIQDNNSSIYAGSIQIDNVDTSGMTTGQACVLVFDGNAYLSFASEL